MLHEAQETTTVSMLRSLHAVRPVSKQRDHVVAAVVGNPVLRKRRRGFDRELIMSGGRALAVALSLAVALAASSEGIASRAALAQECPGSGMEIDTDRPDVTNSSLVVPSASLQAENGINWTASGRNRALDGTNTRLRLGVSECTELLVDLPNRAQRVTGDANSGFSSIAPGLKRQLLGLSDPFQLSVVAGMTLPTGTGRISPGRYNPYLQFPWSRDMADGWGLSGMLTSFWFPDQRQGDPVLQSTIVLGKELGLRTAAFVEFIGEYARAERPSQTVNWGGVYRTTPTQQLDFHAGFGLDRRSPDYFFGIGYSFRLDGIF